jgi:hypothetical protein
MGPVAARLGNAYAVFVVRVWVEDHEEAPLRVVLSRVPSPGEEASPPVVTTSVDAACQALRTWIEELMRGGVAP